jgi:4-hydroxy-3-polyprenylbenzoate decarboxylase
MPQKPDQLSITLAFTGASGAILGQKALELLVLDSRVGQINVVPSPNSLRVARDELRLAERPLNELPRLLLGRDSPKITVHDSSNIGANIASGSYPTAGMLIIPCSMGTLAAIAHGLSNNLIERAADVCLKERKPLVMAVREAPFNQIHLRNMLIVARAGATIFPAMPAFYQRGVSVDDMVTQYVSRVLAHLGLPQEKAFQWHGTD